MQSYLDEHRVWPRARHVGVAVAQEVRAPRDVVAPLAREQVHGVQREDVGEHDRRPEPVDRVIGRDAARAVVVLRRRAHARRPDVRHRVLVEADLVVAAARVVWSGGGGARA